MNTTYFLNLVAGNIFHPQYTQANPKPAIPAYYVGLSSTTPTVGGTNATEPSGNGYARVAISDADLNVPANGVVTNKNMIAFNDSTGSWGTLTHYLVFDAATGGNLLMYGPLSTSRTVENDTTVALRAGALTLTVANPT